jgi:hypothetical protein
MPQSQLMAKWKRGELKFTPAVSVLAEEAGLAQYPTSKVPGPDTIAEDVPFYWWFRFLQLNEKYSNAARAHGNGKLTTLYRDFGDVANVNFLDWWERHYHLFSEPVGKWRFQIARNEQALAPFGRQDVVNLVVPLTWSRQRLRDHFEKIVLSKIPEPAPGKTRAATKAKYKLEGRWAPNELRDAYRVYVERQADAEGTHFRKAHPLDETVISKKVRHVTPWWTIAVRAGLEFHLVAKDKKSPLLREGAKGPDSEQARARAGDAARRHFARALLLIDAAASTRFPRNALEN